MNPSFSASLLDEIAPLWDRMQRTRVFQALLSDDPVGIELFQIYLIESYHYAKHNAQHQAVAVMRADVCNRDFMRSALQHAIEEVDHDQLALRDLERMGFDRREVQRSLPLAETQGFTAFMYDWVLRQNPMGRLGYSLWAEGTHELFPKVIARLKSKFGFTENRSISFFTVHAALDARHGLEARENIDQFCVTADDRQAVRIVAHTSLKLFIGLLEGMYEHYLAVQAGAPLLRQLPPA